MRGEIVRPMAARMQCAASQPLSSMHAVGHSTRLYFLDVANSQRTSRLEHALLTARRRNSDSFGLEIGLGLMTGPGLQLALFDECEHAWQGIIDDAEAQCAHTSRPSTIGSGRSRHSGSASFFKFAKQE